MDQNVCELVPWLMGESSTTDTPSPADLSVKICKKQIQILREGLRQTSYHPIGHCGETGSPAY